MATLSAVKAYLACWFQLGKSVVLVTPAGDHRKKPEQVLGLSQFSLDFEICWAEILSQPQRYYLEGTEESVADLLSGKWDIINCARCTMLIPITNQGVVSLGPCPCADLSGWPNFETLPPRLQSEEDVNVARLNQIRERLLRLP